MTKFKSSFYNIFQPLDDKILAYNSLRDNFLLLDTYLFDIFDSTIKNDDINELKNIHEDFFNALLQNNFIVDATINEFETLKSEVSVLENDETHYTIIINPTMNCNFKCWYCYEEHIKDSKVNNETLTKIYKLIDNVVNDKKIKSFEIGWFGGEPLLYLNQTMKPILEYANERAKKTIKKFRSNITTNGYLINQNAVDLFKKYQLNHFQITLDGNRELHDTIRFVNSKKGSYDKITENIKLLLRNQLSTTLRINFTSETLDSIADILSDLVDISEEDKNYLEISFHQVWQTVDKENEEETNRIEDKLVKNKAFFRKNGFKVVSMKGLNIYNSCYADKKNEALINYNGDVFKCTARDFTKQNSEGVLLEDGQINWFEKNQKRMGAKLNNKPCQECAILPLCGAGCSQVAIESNGKDYCMYNYDETRKKEDVKRHFIESMEQVAV